METPATIPLQKPPPGGDSLERVALVVPCYNEASRLDAAAFRQAARNHRWLDLWFVDDGSSDTTLDLLKQLESDDPAQFHVVALESNHGKAEAVRRGVQAALATAPDLIGYWDADLATPLETLPAMRDVLCRLPHIEIVLGSRRRLSGRRIRRHPMRRILGRLFAAATAVTLDLPVYDTQCGAKLFRNTRVVQRIVSAPFHSRWIFDVEWLVRWKDLVASPSGIPESVYEFPLDAWHDVQGSKLRRRDFLTAFSDLCRIAWKYRVLGESQRLPAGEALSAKGSRRVA